MKTDELTMAVVGISGALAGVLLTWLLKELAETFKLRYEDRQFQGQALADLLEIRHRITEPPRILDMILSRIQAHPGEEVQLRAQWNAFMASVTADTPELRARFNRTVDALAKSVPVLSFTLRSKDTLLPLFEWLQSLSTLQPAAYLSMKPVVTKLMSEVDNTLKSTCRSLAWSHGCWTWFQVVRRFRNRKNPSIEMEKALIDMRNLIAADRGNPPLQ